MVRLALDLVENAELGKRVARDGPRGVGGCRIAVGEGALGTI